MELVNTTGEKNTIWTFPHPFSYTSNNQVINDINVIFSY